MRRFAVCFLAVALPVAATAAARRPQTPAKPYPYHEAEVTYANPASGFSLAATLTVPNGPGPFPAVLLITGSGPQDRNETIADHHPFLVLADYLTRHGIVVLRADDRGVGMSGGNFNTATTADFATDAEAGLAYLATREEVDPARLGLIGHSEGGEIASMVAARNSAVRFIVMMAGPATPGDQLLLEQQMLIAKVMGVADERTLRAQAEEREVLDLIKAGKDDATVEHLLHQQAPPNMTEHQFRQQAGQLTSAWFRYFVSYDPAVDLTHVTCPVLALNGSRDLQVPAKSNLPAMRAALDKAGNKNVEIVELPKLNHLFQTARTGSPTEYGQIEETIAPVALDKIATWILAQR